MSKIANLKVEIDYLPADAKAVIDEFNKNIFENIFYRNRSFLKDNSDVTPFSKNTWEYNPQCFCLEHYGTDQFYPIILIVNNLKSIFEFYPDKLEMKIYSPTLNIINSLLTLSRV